MRNIVSKTLAKSLGTSGRKSKVAKKRKVTGKVKGAPSKITRRRKKQGSILSGIGNKLKRKIISKRKSNKLPGLGNSLRKKSNPLKKLTKRIGKRRKY
jgi:hypothetical protein